MALYLFLVLGMSVVAAQEYAGDSLGLTEVPGDIPANTTVLRLNHNNLANADFAALGRLALHSVYLVSNGFTTFPDLTIVGASLRELYLGANSISNISITVLTNLDALQVLDLEENLFTAFPDLGPIGDTLNLINLSANPLQTIQPSVLDSLTNLTVLKIAMIPDLVLSVEDLNPLADTLQSLIMFQNEKVEFGNVSAFVELVSLDLSGSQTPVFPAMPVPCDAMERVYATAAGLTSLGTELKRCKNVRRLQFSNNALTSIPNITAMGQSLTHLLLSNNRIPSIAPAITRALVSLIDVTLDNNELTEFPDLTMSGATLKTLTIHSNKISNLDQSLVAPLVNLDALDLHGNQFTSVPDVWGLIQIDHLLLSDNPIHTARPRHLASLGGLRTVDLRNTDLQHLPTMCPRGSLTLKLEGITALDLCSPAMAWLKQASLTVSVTDVLCPALGKMWSAATFADLVTVAVTPAPPQPGTVRRKAEARSVSLVYLITYLSLAANLYPLLKQDPSF
jgi:Leucine-rich repeat (LRR) protein